MLPNCRLSVPARGRGRMLSFLGTGHCRRLPGSPVSLPDPAGWRRQTTSCLKCRAVKGAGAMDRCYQGLRSHRWARCWIDGERPVEGRLCKQLWRTRRCGQKAPGCGCDRRTAWRPGVGPRSPRKSSQPWTWRGRELSVITRMQLERFPYSEF